jgi:lysophospholipase L1-like esterase
MKFSQMYGPLGLISAAISPVVALNFMPLGDSITEFGCWRAYLQGLLQEAGAPEADWIGSVSDTKTCNGVGDWDRDHEGHAGYLAIDIANQWLTGWLAPAAPDIVFFHLGTNDITGGHSTDEILGAYGQMVEEMRASNPAVQILVSCPSTSSAREYLTFLFV